VTYEQTDRHTTTAYIALARGKNRRNLVTSCQLAYKIKPLNGMCISLVTTVELTQIITTQDANSTSSTRQNDKVAWFVGLSVGLSPSEPGKNG